MQFDFSKYSSFLQIIIDLYGNPGFIGQEYSKYFWLVPAAIGAFFVTLMTTPLIGQVSKMLGITYKSGVSRKGKAFDNPIKHIHQGEIPAPGGLSIILTFVLFFILFYRPDQLAVPFIIALAILTIGSFLDDIYNLPAPVQLAYQCVAASIIAFSVIDITLLNTPLGPMNLDWYSPTQELLGMPFRFIFPGDIILVLWIIGSINAFKVVGGSPGLIESNSLIAFLLLYIIGVRTNSELVSLASSLLIGSTIAFLYFAVPPPKIFSGSTGKTVYGFLISTLAVINGSKLATAIMILLLPIIDYTFVLIRRYLTHKPRNFVELMRINDTTHLHHQLLQMGFSQKQVLFIEISITLLIGSVAVFSTGALKAFLLIFLALLTVIFVLGINLAVQKRKEKKEETPPNDSTPVESPESRYSY